jgi:hypothetical protein
MNNAFSLGEYLVSGSESLFLNGVLLEPGIDYQMAGIVEKEGLQFSKKVVVTEPPQAGDRLAVVGINPGGIVVVQALGVSWVFRNSLRNHALWSHPSKNVNGIVYHDGQFTLVGASGAATSPDGITWTMQPDLLNKANGVYSSIIRVVSWVFGDFYVAAGSNGSLATSPDGITWTKLTTGLGSNTINAVAWSGNRLIIVGIMGNYAVTEDFVNWTSNNNLYDLWGYNSVNDVVWGGGKFVAVGKGGRCATSPDGVSWTMQPGLSAAVGSSYDALSIAWSGSRFCVVGEGGISAVSEDGVNWDYGNALRDNAGYTRASDVIWAGDQFFAVGNDLVAWSIDGSEWQAKKPLPAGTGNNLRAVAWNGDEGLCSGGTGGSVYTSGI